jgi:hypothetical protein
MRWTKDMVDWLRKNKSNHNNREELLNDFNKMFNVNLTLSQLSSKCKHSKISLRFNILWEDKIEWLIKSKEIYDDREDILNAFNKHFNLNIKINRLTDISTRYKLDLPIAKRMKMKGIEQGWIKLRGYKTLPIGSDINRDNPNRPYIKKANGDYAVKSRYIYETYHNVKLDPANDVIIFLDDDYTNFSKENLYRLPRKTHALYLNHRLHKVKSVDKLTLIKYCEWKEKIFNLKGKGE